MTAPVPTAAVIGHPVAHSLSPRIHRYWLAQLGMEGEYSAHDVAPGNLADAVKDFADRGYSGLNVTIPHKETVLKICNELSPAARAIGAVNTVIFREGKIYGDNTDAAGFAANLTATVPGARFDHAVILGAGGAARAVVFALKSLGVEKFTIINRSGDRAEKLVADLKIEATIQTNFSPLASRLSLLVNTTSLGMHGQPPLEIDISGFPPRVVVADIVYKPLRTELLKAAAARGHAIVDGLGMLIHQAALAFEQFYGAKPEVKPDLRAMIEKELEK